MLIDFTNFCTLIAFTANEDLRTSGRPTWMQPRRVLELCTDEDDVPQFAPTERDQASW